MDVDNGCHEFVFRCHTLQQSGSESEYRQDRNDRLSLYPQQYHNFAKKTYGMDNATRQILRSLFNGNIRKRSSRSNRSNSNSRQDPKIQNRKFVPIMRAIRRRHLVIRDVICSRNVENEVAASRMKSEPNCFQAERSVTDQNPEAGESQMQAHFRQTSSQFGCTPMKATI